MARTNFMNIVIIWKKGQRNVVLKKNRNNLTTALPGCENLSKDKLLSKMGWVLMNDMTSWDDGVK